MTWHDIIWHELVKSREKKKSSLVWSISIDVMGCISACDMGNMQFCKGAIDAAA